jgi:molybdate transport system ATP-binding protein
MSEPFLSFRLRKEYPDFQLDVEADLGAGITAIFGPSGGGKTTTLGCLAGLTVPDAGEVIMAGRTLFSPARKVMLPPERRRLGYVFQDALLFPHLTVRDNLLYGHRRTPAALRRIDPRDLVELLELGPFLERRPATLSGGEAQRVALARALATSPEALLLDEPLASLDGALRGRILRYLKTLHQELQIPMIYVSHSMSEVLFLADQVLVLSKGGVVAQGEPHRLLYQPTVKPLLDLASLENLLEVEVVRHHPESRLTEVRAPGDLGLWVSLLDRPPGTRLSLALRAADILIATQAPEHLSARNVLRATISALESVGDSVLVTAEAGTPLLVEVSQGATESLGLVPGLEIFLVIKSSSILVLD